MADNKRPITFKIKRSLDGKRDASTWEEFEVPWEPQMNVISALMAIQREPVTKGGKETVPVVWEQACLEEVCGSCTLIINGKVRQACTAITDGLLEEGETVTIEPMTKFPLVRDLIVDRSRMFDNLKRAKAWVFLDGTHALGP